MMSGGNIAGEVGQGENEANEINRDDNGEAETREHDKEEFYWIIRSVEATLAALLRLFQI